MPTITVLPHAEICPAGKTFEATPGRSLLDSLLDQGIDVEHASSVNRRLQRRRTVRPQKDCRDAAGRRQQF